HHERIDSQVGEVATVGVEDDAVGVEARVERPVRIEPCEIVQCVGVRAETEEAANKNFAIPLHESSCETRAVDATRSSERAARQMEGGINAAIRIQTGEVVSSVRVVTKEPAYQDLAIR